MLTTTRRRQVWRVLLAGLFVAGGPGTAAGQRLDDRDSSRLSRQSPTEAPAPAETAPTETAPSESATARPEADPTTPAAPGGPKPIPPDAPPPVDPLPVDRQAVVTTVVDRTNALRADEGLPPVTVSPVLTRIAQDFADYMARTDEYGHHADGRTPAERAAAGGYDYCVIGENIQYQYRSDGFTTERLGETMYAGWRDSPPHRKNMLDADVTETGVAIAQSPTTEHYYGVQLFGRPKSQAIEVVLANLMAEPVVYRLGEQKFVLPARYVRTHTECRTTELAVVPPADAAADGQAKDTPTPPATPSTAVPIRADAAYEFVADAGQPGGVGLKPTTRDALPATDPPQPEQPPAAEPAAPEPR